MKKDKKKHLQWMLNNMPDDYEKRCRWVGFMQGTLWSFDIRSIEDMRYDIIVDVKDKNKTLEHTIGIIKDILNDKVEVYEEDECVNGDCCDCNICEEATWKYAVVGHGQDDNESIDHADHRSRQGR